jgi:FkbH-like protein
MTRHTLERERVRREYSNRDDFIASLDLKIDCRKLSATEDPLVFDRVAELLRRTTQFTTTGVAPTVTEIAAAARSEVEGVYVVHVRDRFGDHGLVGVGVVSGEGEVRTFAISCRVLGLGIERALLDRITDDQKGRVIALTGRIVETARNLPVRNLYRSCGFTEMSDGIWRLKLQ